MQEKTDLRCSSEASGCPWSYFKKWLFSSKKTVEGFRRDCAGGGHYSCLESQWSVFHLDTCGSNGSQIHLCYPTSPSLPPSGPVPLQLLHIHPHKHTLAYILLIKARNTAADAYKHSFPSHHTLVQFSMFNIYTAHISILVIQADAEHMACCLVVNDWIISL